jgi:uncharacterized Zn finger protein
MTPYYGFEPRRTVETDEGIKARSSRGEFVKNWWATRWIEAMEQLMDRGRLSRGRRYARKGQVLSLDESPGKVTASVQGSRTRPYAITIKIQPFKARQWSKVIDALADRPIFMAQLLAGEMPQDIEDAFADAGLSLFPDTLDDLDQRCTCPDWADVCKHLAATHYILAERFDEDPFLLFRLRGRSQEQLMDELSKRQGIDVLKESNEPEYETVPLPVDPADFWSAGARDFRFPARIEPPPVPHPRLVRMGAPSFLENIEELLGPVYDAITQEAVASVLAEEVSRDENEDVDDGAYAGDDEATPSDRKIATSSVHDEDEKG